ncbi:MAG: hypothetical protein AB8E82_18250 [Aureispira sp.]
MKTSRITLFLLFALLYTACSSEKSSSWQIALNLGEFSLLQNKQPLFIGEQFYYCSNNTLFIHNINNGTLIEEIRLSYTNPSKLVYLKSGLIISYPHQERMVFELRSHDDGHLIKEVHLPFNIKGIYPNSDSSNILLLYTDSSAKEKSLQASLYNINEESKTWTISNLPLVHQPSFVGDYICWLGTRDNMIVINQETGEQITELPSDLPPDIVLSQYALTRKQRTVWRMWNKHNNQLVDPSWSNYIAANKSHFLIDENDSVVTIITDTTYQTIITPIMSNVSPLLSSDKSKIVFSYMEEKKIYYYDLQTKNTKSKSLEYTIDKSAYFYPVFYYKNILFYTTIKNYQYHLVGQKIES